MVTFRPLVSAIALGGIVALGALSGSALASNSSATAGLTPGTHLPFARVMPALLPNSKENTSVVAQNNGSAPATIAMDIYTPGGVLIPSASKVETNVPPDATRTFAQAINSGLTPGFRGVGVISSDQPINALLVRDIEQNGTGKKSYSVHNAYGTGAMVVTLPYLSNNLAGTYQTRFAIANTGNVTACVTISYAFDGGGGLNDAPTGLSGCASGYPVPVGGQVAFGPQTVAAEATQAMPAGTAGKLMSATITATGAPVTVAVDAYVTSGQRKLASYDGFVVGDPNSTTDDISKTIAIPLALKIDGYYSQILISNPNATAASAVITYAGTVNGGAQQTFQVPLSVPANGTANHSVYASGSPIIPEGFVGAATVTSDQPLAAVLFRIKMTSPGSFVDEDLYTAVNGVPTDRATTTVKLPLIFRRIAAGGGFYGYNTWVSVVVADGSTANVTLTTVTDTSGTPASCGALATYTTTHSVPGSYVFYQNSDDAPNNGLGANPTCLWAGMKITSDKPIIVIANVTTDIAQGDNDGEYNGFGQ